jgi:hypothetical protein
LRHANAHRLVRFEGLDQANMIRTEIHRLILFLEAEPHAVCGFEHTDVLPLGASHDGVDRHFSTD